MKYTFLFPLAFVTLAACGSDTPAPAPAPVTEVQDEPADCEAEGRRDDQGRPVPQC